MCVKNTRHSAEILVIVYPLGIISSNLDIVLNQLMPIYSITFFFLNLLSYFTIFVLHFSILCLVDNVDIVQILLFILYHCYFFSDREFLGILSINPCSGTVVIITYTYLAFNPLMPGWHVLFIHFILFYYVCCDFTLLTFFIHSH